MDLTNVFCTMEPCSVGGVGAIKENMYVVLDIENGVGLDRVLLLIILFQGFVLGVDFAVNRVDLSALLLFSVITSQTRRNSIGTYIIAISPWKLSFFSKSDDVHFRRLQPVVNLATSPSWSKTPTIGEHGVRGDDFV